MISLGDALRSVGYPCQIRRCVRYRGLCKARVIGQEYHCGRCGYVWDLNDPEPPKCKTRREVAAQHIAKLREQLKHA